MRSQERQNLLRKQPQGLVVMRIRCLLRVEAPRRQGRRLLKEVRRSGKGRSSTMLVISVQRAELQVWYKVISTYVIAKL